MTLSGTLTRRRAEKYSALVSPMNGRGEPPRNIRADPGNRATCISGATAHLRDVVLWRSEGANPYRQDLSLALGRRQKTGTPGSSPSVTSGRRGRHGRDRPRLRTTIGGETTGPGAAKILSAVSEPAASPLLNSDVKSVLRAGARLLGTSRSTTESVTSQMRSVLRGFDAIGIRGV